MYLTLQALLTWVDGAISLGKVHFFTSQTNLSISSVNFFTNRG